MSGDSSSDKAGSGIFAILSPLRTFQIETSFPQQVTTAWPSGEKKPAAGFSGRLTSRIGESAAPNVASKTRAFRRGLNSEIAAHRRAFLYIPETDFSAT